MHFIDVIEISLLLVVIIHLNDLYKRIMELYADNHDNIRVMISAVRIKLIVLDIALTLAFVLVIELTSYFKT
jgi:hypothetical protein